MRAKSLRIKKRPQIEALLQSGLTDRAIAERVGCHPVYVRVVRNQGTKPEGEPSGHSKRAYFESWADRKARRLRERQALLEGGTG